MISDEELDRYRVEGVKLRVIRDELEGNDVKGIVVAWDETSVLIRKQNRNMVKLNRGYRYQPADMPRGSQEVKEGP